MLRRQPARSIIGTAARAAAAALALFSLAALSRLLFRRGMANREGVDSGEQLLSDIPGEEQLTSDAVAEETVQNESTDSLSESAAQSSISAAAPP
jgi:hypothetical protein